MKGVANRCRTNFGRNCIQYGYKKHLTLKLTHLKDLYHLTYVNLTIDKNKTSEQRPVVCANSKELVEKVCVEREYDGNPNVIITIDGMLVVFSKYVLLISEMITTGMITLTFLKPVLMKLNLNHLD